MIPFPYVNGTDFIVLLALARRSGSRMKSIISLTHVQIRDVRINLSRGNIRVAEHCLHRTRVGAVLHQVRAKAVTQSMWRNFRHSRRRRMRLNHQPGRLSRH